MTGLVGLLIVGVIPKWALLAPIFMKLGVAPEAVLVAYRLGDSPPNVITPLMSYFALFIAWELLGIPVRARVTEASVFRAL